jgi:hypothetical protein
MTTPPPTAAVQPDRCPSCQCEDCGGTLADHTETGCTCEDCTFDPEYACTAFAPSVRVAYLAQALAPLLSAHLHDRAQRRCLAVAHAAHHALIAYDHPEDTPR